MVLAVAVPVAVAAIVLALVLPGMFGTSELHRAVGSYLTTVGDGATVPARGAGGGCPAGQEDPAAALHRLAGPGFGHHIVSSIETGDSASVNVDLTPKGGAPVQVSLDLHRDDGHWTVCTASAGRILIDPDPF